MAFMPARTPLSSKYCFWLNNASQGQQKQQKKIEFRDRLFYSKKGEPPETSASTALC